MRVDGKLKSWNDERGFGFITPAQGGQDIFVHIKSFPTGTRRPAIGLALTFEIESSSKGKLRAKSVQWVRAPLQTASRRVESPAPWTVARMLLLPGFLALYAFIATRWSVSTKVIAVYALASMIAFIVYAIDKSAARHGRRRTPEATLHFLGLACGWPGALLAQQLLRHKTSKPSFVGAFWATIVLNILGLVALHTPLIKRLVA